MNSIMKTHLGDRIMSTNLRDELKFIGEAQNHEYWTIEKCKSQNPSCFGFSRGMNYFFEILHYPGIVINSSANCEENMKCEEYFFNPLK